MKAILLGYDKDFGFIQLAYKAYMALWPDCPLIFRIPINDRNNPDFAFFSGKPNVELIDSPSPFKATARALLEGIGDEEWVYWCISDRYPSYLNVGKINKILKYIAMGSADPYNAIRLINTHEQVNSQSVMIDDLAFFHKVGYHFGFWHHQFLKAKVLRFNLCHPLLAEDYHVSYLNRRFHLIADRPDGMLSVFEQTLVPKEAIMHISEPCLNGHITINGLSDLTKYGCKIPKLPLINKQAHF
jgi:hypothetical protein